MSSYLPCVEINPTVEARISVIWLHGLGADGHDFAPIVPELKLPAELPIRFVFPHAPSRPITINNGYVMPGWFDILSFDRDDIVDHDGIAQSVSSITQLIEREIERGVDHKHIVLAGFSQGGAIAMHTALRYAAPLGGLMVLSSYLPAYETLKDHYSEANNDIAFFMAHGSFDPVLPITLGKRSFERLNALGYSINWHEYPMEHSVCAEEIMDIASWLKSLPALNEY